MRNTIMHIAAMCNNKDDHKKDNYDKDDHNEVYNQLLESQLNKKEELVVTLGVAVSHYRIKH